MTFYFRLARELGMTVSRMLTEMTSQEIAYWMSFLQLEIDIQKEIEETEKKQKIKSDANLLKARLTEAGKFAAKKK